MGFAGNDAVLKLGIRRPRSALGPKADASTQDPLAGDPLQDASSLEVVADGLDCRSISTAVTTSRSFDGSSAISLSTMDQHNVPIAAAAG